MEEFESIREEMNNELKESNEMNMKKIDELQDLISKFKAERQDQKLSVIKLEQYKNNYFYCKN